MGKTVFLIAIVLFLDSTNTSFAQVPDFSELPPPPAVPLRDVNGIVKDSTGQVVIGATVTLHSKQDTVRTATNQAGIFMFKNIKEATFVLTVEGIGYQKSVIRYMNNDATALLTLDPILLKTESTMLGEVTVKGRPTIVYKIDTIEYKASDYKVRENATLDELLKKAEGFLVGKDGTLIHHGQEIKKVKLNGKEYAGGNVAQAIQNLPADIIDRFQVVDDYGDQAARTGIKIGNPQKILNVTTKADRSIGNMTRMTGQAGNNERYNTQLFAQRFNANQELGVIGNLSNTITGIASGINNSGEEGPNVEGAARIGSSPGTTRSGSPSFNYRDQWNRSVQVNSSYRYDFTDNHSINNSYGQRYTSIGSSQFADQSTSRRNTKSHIAEFEMDIELDSANYLQIKPTYGYSGTNGLSNALTDNINRYTTGFEHELSNGASSNLYTGADYGLATLYVHSFKKARRNVSIRANISQQNTRADGGTDKNYRFYADSTRNTLLKDSAVNLLTNQSNKNTVYETTVTFTEPMSLLSQLEFIGNVRWSDNDSRSTQDTVLANGQLKRLGNLDQIYSYSTLQQRLTLNYRYNGIKTNLTLGATAIPYTLKGTKIDNSTGRAEPTSRSNFRVIPAFRFLYTVSATESFQLTYSAANQEPNFQQLQPFTDRSDPRNLIVGNPDLKPEFTNFINAAYNNYIVNSQLNLSFGINAFSTDNKVTTNILQVRRPLTVDPVDPSRNTYTNINEIHYVNLEGAKGLLGRYSVSKQLDERRYQLSLVGNLLYRYTPAMSNGFLYHSRNWRFTQRLASRMNPTDNIEINPFVELSIDQTFITTLHSQPTHLRTIKLAIDGRMYFLRTLQINYSASKNYVTGITGYNTNPFVFNAGFEKQFLPRKNLVATFTVYDLFHQNNFIQQVVTPQGVINTESNALSRYFLIGLRLNLQKWSGTPTRRGEPMRRRGDGSFIY